MLWSGGAITDLTPDLPANQGGAATAINEVGQVVGQHLKPLRFSGRTASARRSESGRRQQRGERHQRQRRSRRRVLTTDMTPLGLMQRPFVWQNGVMTDLGVLPGDEDGRASAINNAGQIVGSSGRTDPDTYESFYRAFIHANGVMTPLPVPSPEAYASDINENGVVVGTMRAAAACRSFTGGSTSTAS